MNSKHRLQDVHPDHQVHHITPTSPWRCDVCKRESDNIQEIQCYHCEECDVHMCKECFSGINSPLHHHTLYCTDVKSVYPQSNGKWACDVCGKNNGPGHFYPAHCSQCKFDLCDNCIKPYSPGHVMYKADSNVTYSRFNGEWYCDRCRQRFTPQRNNAPYHCSQCEFDLCDSCMTTTGDVTTAGKNTSGDRSGHHATVSNGGKSITSPVEEIIEANTGPSALPIGRPGPPGDNEYCTVCLTGPKDATIMHGITGHSCCCTACAQDLERRRAGCPICGAPIDLVITSYTV